MSMSYLYGSLYISFFSTYTANNLIFMIEHYPESFTRTEHFSSALHWISSACHILVDLSWHNKILQTGWLRQQTFILHNLGGWKPMIKVPACSGTGESSPLNLQIAAFLLYPHMVERERDLSLLILIREKRDFSLSSSYWIKAPSL